MLFTKRILTMICLGMGLTQGVVCAEDGKNSATTDSKTAPAASTQSVTVAFDQKASETSTASSSGISKPFTALPPPPIAARSYVLMDASSGKILANSNMDSRLPPASLTKLMTIYLVERGLKSGQLSLKTSVPISKNAWKTGGSKMFIRVGTEVSVNELIHGIIVASGNDATVALAEYIGGTEAGFVQLMNQTAAELGMKNSHFEDSNGLPNANHYASAHDLAILSRAIITEFPEYYPWFKERWVTFNNIKQPNRNRLLWRDSTVDGLKTGYTPEAQYCLATSAVRNNLRLISVVMGAKNEEERSAQSQAILNYGYRNFESHPLFEPGTPIMQPRVWQGQDAKIGLGVAHSVSVTIPTGAYKLLQAKMDIQNPLSAPVMKGQQYGTLKVMLNDEVLAQVPIVALADDPKGSVWTRLCDHIAWYFHHEQA